MTRVANSTLKEFETAPTNPRPTRAKPIVAETSWPRGNTFSANATNVPRPARDAPDTISNRPRFRAMPDGVPPGSTHAN